MIKNFGVAYLALAAAIVLVLSVSTGCGKGPTGPSGYDPSKPITEDNVPVCTGNCALATARYGVYEGDCTGDPATCAKEIFPTMDPALWVLGREKTYLLRNHQQKYTLHLWVTHSGVTGRTIGMGVVAVTSALNLPLFREENQPSPVHGAVVFSLTIPGGGITNTDVGQVEFHEGAWDLTFKKNDWKVPLGFRFQP